MTSKPLEETFSFLLAEICKAHRNFANEVLNEIGLHTGQEMILNVLWREEGLPQSQVADATSCAPPTTTKMLQRMESAGLIQRRSDAEDSRVSRVYLTERGRGMKQTVEDKWRELEDRTVANLSTEERILLRRLLLQVQDNLRQP